MSKSIQTPGPWMWRSNDGGKTNYLRTVGRGGLIVLDAVRAGMQGATIRLATRNTPDQGGFLRPMTVEDATEHPDAILIREAPALAESLRQIVRLHADMDGEPPDAVMRAAETIARQALALLEPKEPNETDL